MSKSTKSLAVRMNRCLVVRMSLSEKCAYACGHTDAEKFDLLIFGWLISWKKLKESLDCPQCQLKAKLKEIFRCAICGRGLFVGDRVKRCNVDLLRGARWGRSMVVKPYIQNPDKFAAVCSEHQVRGEDRLWRLGATELEWIHL